MMHLLELPDELLLHMIRCIVDHTAIASNSPRALLDWVQSTERHLSQIDAATSDIVNVAGTCKKLHRLAYTNIYSTLPALNRTIGNDWPGDIDNQAVHMIHTDVHSNIHHFSRFPNVETVILSRIWEYNSFWFAAPSDPEPCHGVHKLRCIDCSLGLGALRTIYSVFSSLHELWYEHGAYETILGETRTVWAPVLFADALQMQSTTLRTLVLTRGADSLPSIYRLEDQAQDWPSRIKHLDLVKLEVLAHVHIAEIFLFGIKQVAHHRVDSLSDRLPPSLQTLSVLYDEPNQVAFKWDAPPGVELLTFPSAGWPCWPSGIARDKVSGALPLLQSVEVFERRMAYPVSWGYLDNDHDGVAADDLPNRVSTAPPAIAETIRKNGIDMKVLLNAEL